jgi:hypothetical protein
VPGANPERVVLVPEPEIAPGLIIHEPEGKPFRITLPVANVQVGCVIVPTVGAEGVAGCALITTLVEDAEVQLLVLVTMNVYVPAVSPFMVVLVPLPVTDPGLMVQLPAGNPLSTTLPVETVQVGCVMAPTTGDDGVVG